MAGKLHLPETTGDDAGTIDSGLGALEREIARVRPADWASRPQLFRMRARLPRKGRAAALLASTDRMWMALKTYAEGGENELHTHTNEDHGFIVLQGRARFFGPDGESVVLGRNEGIMLPRGCLYRFETEGDEPLVVLRVGCVVDAARSPWGRTDAEGRQIFGNAAENNTVETVFDEDKVFG